ncbi:NAD-dependent epimerase/dehydratase family protein [Exiguobacterium sp. B2(2022)]|uniref:NAD-dependent epimerase/dehydratase family protein n=1 Tax=Exiguobacterium sp. B2(2022) TaxID=2992755 RepID=UPI00237A44CB|nr:NAD-dependent epimerase/dehydratase family protein [Exiguobacterium sp. B2(2022)]MDE0564745.1 NAD-dependent epimerase/dehydratase family protein [Exiguobacterium sp. B2(2022)]
MKKVLITGASSYVGNSFKQWVSDNYSSKIEVESVGTRSGEWKQLSFEGYDVVLHVAAVVHVSMKKNMKKLYYQVNTDLTEKIAKKAKKEGVRQFVFMSSMSVYGDASNLKLITHMTNPNPANYYGMSKLQAEKRLALLEDDSFIVACIRPPMIYGKGAIGNYVKLAKLARKIPFFPNYKNQRSMIHIDNLCEFLTLVILHRYQGTFHPQNSEYVCTSDLVSTIGKVHDNRVRKIKIFNPLIKLVVNRHITINKLFSDFAYSKELSTYQHEYIVRDFKESIVLTEQDKE